MFSKYYLNIIFPKSKASIRLPFRFVIDHSHIISLFNKIVHSFVYLWPTHPPTLFFHTLRFESWINFEFLSCYCLVNLHNSIHAFALLSIDLNIARKTQVARVLPWQLVTWWKKKKQVETWLPKVTHNDDAPFTDSLCTLHQFTYNKE